MAGDLGATEINGNGYDMIAIRALTEFWGRQTRIS